MRGRCDYCGEPTDYRNPTTRAYVCDFAECNASAEDEERDEDGRAYEEERRELDERYGRGGP